jgi:hypothetical protein
LRGALRDRGQHLVGVEAGALGEIERFRKGL